MSSEEKTRLTYDKWSIEQNKGVAVIYATGESGQREWVASTTDPKRAMEIVEGLVLVEHKRFYRPEATPVFVSGNDRPLPPFLRKKGKSPTTAENPRGGFIEDLRDVECGCRSCSGKELDGSEVEEDT